MLNRVAITHVRNIGILAHIDAGKTTLTERVLYFTGLVRRPGEVHEGTATTDFSEEEQSRGITISAATVTAEWRRADVRHAIRIIDTPGHVDFSVEVERSLRVLDGAVFVLDASEGVECQSETVWRQAERHGVPRLVFVNKMDKVGADFAATVADLRARLAARPMVVQLPLGEQGEHRGVIDLVAMRALVFAGREMSIEAIPRAHTEAAARARATLVETCAEVDDRVLAKWAAGVEPGEAELESAIRRGTLSGRFHVVLCGSAYRETGVQPLLDAIAAYLPSPADRPPAEGRDPLSGRAIERAPEESAPLSALAFKTTTDKVGTLALVRLYSGRLTRGDRVWVSSSGRPERVGRLYMIHAAGREEIAEARAGDIVGITGMRSVQTGDTLAAAGQPIALEAIEIPEPVLEVALEPRTSQDRERLGQALARLVADDPSLGVRVDDESGQLVIRTLGELHAEIVQSRLARDWGVVVRPSAPVVAYRDTVRRAARADVSYAKQGGGAGQYAKVSLEVDAGAAGSGIHFENATVGGAVPAPYVVGVEKGVRALCSRGVRRGYPLVDLVVRLVDGAHHVKDSSPMAFEIAASMALAEAVHKAGLQLLEPVAELEVSVPDADLGAVVGNLAARRGRIEHMTTRDGFGVVEARVPLSELFGYVPALRGMTHGRGSARTGQTGYEPVPDRVEAQVLDA